MKADQSFICTCAILCCVIQATYSEKEAPADFSSFGANDSDWRNNNLQIDRNDVTKNRLHTLSSKNSKDLASAVKLNRKLMDIAGPKFLVSKHMRLKLLEIIPGLLGLTQKQISPLNSLSFVRADSDPMLRSKLEKTLRIIGDRKTSVRSVEHVETSIDRSEIENFGLKSHTFEADSAIPHQTTNPPPNKFDAIVEEQSIDPTIINEGLMEDPHFESEQVRRIRNKRSAARLLHKLIRIPYVNLTEVPVLKENNSSDIKLNTSSFESPYYKTELSLVNVENMTALSYEQVEDLAFADLNGTEVELNSSKADDEQLPNAEELIAGPRYRIANKYRASLGKGDTKRKRIPVRIHHVPMLQKKCERFTASMCIKADDYPMEQIMGSIRRHKNAMSALLAEYHDKAAELEYQEQLEEFELNKRRREDGNVITPGGMCASIVRYARPQKARSASGEWKYIVNTGRHTQTLRMEKCSSPQESCSYLSHNYRSRCTQVYNYHRLLSWDKTRGLHVDIFKVPTCCSCQVDGYRETFPPAGSSKLKEYQDYTPVPNNNPYSGIDDGIDYEDEDIDTGPAYQFGGISRKNKYNDFKHSELLLGSTNIRTKVNPPRQTPSVGSYLSPPSGSYERQLLKNTRPTYYTYQNNALNGNRQKPLKNYIPSESRVDLEISGTEHSGKEVKTYSLNESPKVQQKRKRVYTGLSNTESPYQAAGPIQTQPASRYIPTTESTVQSNTDGSVARKEISNGKRINYDYHPIIDFFESHQKTAKGHMPMRSTPINSVPKNTETIIPRDRRIGYGSGGPENNWHPVMINS